MTNFSLKENSMPDFALKIKEIPNKGWWVYRYDFYHRGALKNIGRIVFYSQTREAIEEWVKSKNDESNFVILT